MYVTLNKLTFNRKYINLMGELDTDGLVPDNIKFIHRSAKTVYLFPIHTIEDGIWSIKINVEFFSIKHGKWDVFFIGDNFKPIRVTPNKDFSSPQIPILLNNQMSKSLVFYATKYDNLSLDLKNLPIYLDNYSSYVKKNQGIVFEGELSSNLIDITNHNALSLLCNPKSSEDYLFKVNSKTIISENKVKIKFNLSSDLLDTIATTNEGKWNVDLLIEVDSISIITKLVLTDNLIKMQTSLLIQNEYLKQVFLYSSINNYLSLGNTKAKINSGVSTCQLSKTSLLLNGYAYIEGSLFNKDDSYNRTIIVKKRDSDTVLFEQSLPMANDLLKNSTPQFYSEDNTEFLINIPLKQILKKLEVGAHIIDLWININYNSFNITRKLGLKEFEYKKDFFGKTRTLLVKNKVSCTYMDTTPYGNIKLLNYTHNILAYLCLKYGNSINKLPKKEIWLIGERSDTAQDNGYHFFKYCRENYPELDIYYIVKSSSKDFEQVAQFGNVVKYGSFKHYWLVSQATTYIGTHDLEYILPTPGFELSSYREAKRVFLQHGVLGRKYVEYNKNFYEYPFDLFFVSSDYEKKLVEDKYSYSEKEIKVTGLSRFDSLLKKEKEKNSILLIPTWRDWIVTEEQFSNSEYFEKYYSLLTNQKLIQILEESNLTIEFYIHYRMQQFIHHFDSINNNRIKIIKLGEVSVQNLIKRNKLMITDYSSVSFDFNYLSKPIIFYHFDVKRFFNNGIMRPVDETFLGDIVIEEDHVINLIEEYRDNNFKEKGVFSDRKIQVFNNVDMNNNARVFNEIIKLQKRSQV